MEDSSRTLLRVKIVVTPVGQVTLLDRKDRKVQAPVLGLCQQEYFNQEFGLCGCFDLPKVAIVGVSWPNARGTGGTTCAVVMHFSEAR